MNVEIEELSPCRRKLTITVPAEEVSSEYDEALAVWRKRASIPGFRPGKAPVHLVKAKYNKDILGGLRDHLVPKSYRAAIEENKLEVSQIVEADDDIKVTPGEPMSFCVTLDLKPSFSLPEYKGITLKKQTPVVEDAEIEEQIDEIRAQRANYEEVSDRPVCRGDMARIDFTASLDGVPLTEAAPKAVGLDKGEDFWLQANDEAFIPELGEGLAGLSVGDETDITVTFDDNFAAEDLRGKTVVFHVTLKGIRARVLPELDEEFLKPFEVEDVTAFRSKIRDSIASRKEQAEQQRLRGEIEKFLLENTEIELPESEVDAAANRQLRRIINDMSHRGMEESQILEQRDAIVDASKAGAANTVKLRHIFMKIAREEGISVSDADLKREMTMMAYAYGMKPGDLEKELGGAEAKEDFRGDVLVRRTLQHVFDLANIQD